MAPVEETEIPELEGRKVVNGWFGVPKDKFVTDDASPYCGQQVLRWIQNLTASNVLFRDIDGDLAGLPFLGQWQNLHLQPSVFFWSIHQSHLRQFSMEHSVKEL